MSNVTKSVTSHRFSLLLLIIALACGLFAVGCGNDLNEGKNENNPSQNPNNDENSENNDTYPNISHKKSADGYTTTTVNSSAADKWIYLQLSTGAETTVGDPPTATNWDLAFQRFSILVNGGVSGPSTVEISHLDNVPFQDITHAPAVAYRTDIEGVTDEQGQNPGLAFLAEDTWYDYDGMKHVLNIRDRVYIIHASTGEYYKLQFLDYYDKAGTGGFVQFNWQEIDAPEGTEEDSKFPVLTNTIDVTNKEAVVYVDVATNAEVVVAAPETSDGWDISFQDHVVTVNGGVSGIGNVEIAHVDDVPFQDVNNESATNFRSDTDEAGAAFKVDGNWYTYDRTTHIMTPRNRVYLVKNTAGDLFKVQLVGYYENDEVKLENGGHITIKTQKIK